MLDLIGIGLGPFNLSLAALLNDTDLSSQFFERKPQFDWHKGMILPNTTLQVPFMADLVTLMDPTSPFTFLNYLHHHKRLLKFYFLEDFKIFRQEYNHYCQWVASQLEGMRFNANVVDIRYIDDENNNHQGFDVIVSEGGDVRTYQAKHLVVGTGTTPSLPKMLQDIAQHSPERCMHTANFAHHFDLEKVSSDDTPPRILVLGSGQSSAEVYRELFDRQLDSNNQPQFELDWVTRTPGFFPMEYSPLGLEHFSPAYTDYFYDLEGKTKKALLGKQDLLYKGMGFCTIQDIYHRLYERTVAGHALNSALVANCELANVQFDRRLTTLFHQREQGAALTQVYDCIIAGTGYQHALPPCLNSIASDFKYDELAQVEISRHYAVKYQSPHAHNAQVFMQNQELHTHGIGAPDLGLGAYRAAEIVNQLLPNTRYDTSALEVFQHFGVPSPKPDQG